MDEVQFQAFKDFIYKLKYEILTLENYETIFIELCGVETIKYQGSDKWVLYTACHNINPLDGSPKLEFYLDTYNLKCYTHCGTMDIIEFVKKRSELLGKKKSNIQAVKWICNLCNIKFDFSVKESDPNVYNWRSKFGKYLRARNVNEPVELKVYDDSILEYFECVYHQEWIDEHISIQTMIKYEIGWYSYQNCITIPVRNSEGDLVGIRSRFMNPDDKIKYKPTKMLDGTEYKFPTNQVLYGLYYNQKAIKKYKKCVLFEAEKSTLQCDTYFGEDNFSDSMFGKTMSKEKRDLLIALGINEAIIAIDFDYEEVGYYNENDEYIFTKEFEEFKETVYKIGDWFKGFCKVTALISYRGHKMKDSPSDRGKERYLELYNNREELY